MSEELAHYGILRRSGRYPWGSGKDKYQRSVSFQGMVQDLKKQGLSETEIARAFDMTTSQLRATKSMAANERKAEEVARCLSLKEKGLSNVAIGKKLGLPESTVRNYLKPNADARQDAAKSTADLVKSAVDKHKYVEFGSGVESILGVSATQLSTSVAMLQSEGYRVEHAHIRQVGTKESTNIKVLVAPGVTRRELMEHLGDIHTLGIAVKPDGTKLGLQKIASLDSSRLKVRYAEEGGTSMDGTIQIRRGLKDLNLGESNYAQVRIPVDGTHYLKGMAIYSDDMPPGVDVIFNTNKTRDTSKMDTLKKLKDDPDNPFGAVIKRQVFYNDGGKDKLSPINIVNEEGDWNNWSKTLSSQFLSKQSTHMAKQQLGLASKKRHEQFEEIMKLDNPAVRKRLLADFADGCDADSVNLKAAALPRQKSQVILPVPSLKPNEIYAPNFRDGETVCLVRYPHGGTFEIPTVTVNNKHAGARAILGRTPKDAIGIHPDVAERLSGADFDGDSVVVIPVNSQVKVKTSPPLKGLQGFDPKSAYPGYSGMKKMGEKEKGKHMGVVSNLITDMTLGGASAEELARAVRHSMVVIDAAKHGLDWKTSEADNDIRGLKKKYQGGHGAATLISRARGPVYVDEIRLRKASEGGPIDPATGKKVWIKTDRSYTDKNGKVIKAQTKTQKLKVTDDARELISDGNRPMEQLYAAYSNDMKALGNLARRELISTKLPRKNLDAARRYAKEVDELKAAIKLASMNAPRERQAQIIANAVIRAKTADREVSSEEYKKISRQAIAAARLRTGASRKESLIELTDRQWEAIQAGALSASAMEAVVRYSDMEKLSERAIPKANTAVSANVAMRAKAMARNGATTSEVADALGISTNTVLELVR
nr:MAG TPA: RNA dependent RNA polymerase [Caudoviricetes sp.]